VDRLSSTASASNRIWLRMAMGGWVGVNTRTTFQRRSPMIIKLRENGKVMLAAVRNVTIGWGCSILVLLLCVLYSVAFSFCEFGFFPVILAI